MTNSITLEDALVAYWEALDRHPKLSRKEWLTAHPEYASLLNEVAATEMELDRLKSILTPMAKVPSLSARSVHVTVRPCLSERRPLMIDTMCVGDAALSTTVKPAWAPSCGSLGESASDCAFMMSATVSPISTSGVSTAEVTLTSARAGSATSATAKSVRRKA